MDTRQLAESFVSGLAAGDPLRVFQEYYADDVEVHRCRVEEVVVRRGKAAGETAAVGFLTNCTIHSIAAESVLSDGDKAVIELAIDVTPNGADRRATRVLIVQTWKEGKVVRQWNYLA